MPGCVCYHLLGPLFCFYSMRRHLRPVFRREWLGYFIYALIFFGVLYSPICSDRNATLCTRTTSGIGPVWGSRCSLDEWSSPRPRQHTVACRHSIHDPRSSIQATGCALPPPGPCPTQEHTGGALSSRTSVCARIDRRASLTDCMPRARDERARRVRTRPRAGVTRRAVSGVQYSFQASGTSERKGLLPPVRRYRGDHGWGLGASSDPLNAPHLPPSLRARGRVRVFLARGPWRGGGHRHRAGGPLLLHPGPSRPGRLH